ncbi:sialidase [Planctomycetales bacterium]|nr:sialidase [Planctomycetales bacterium]
MQRVIFVIVFCALSSVITYAQQPPAFEIIETKTLSPSDEMYYGWATAAVDRNDQILVVASGGREGHVCPFGRVEFMRSYDTGKTWTFPQTILDSPIDDRDAGILVTPKGTIIVTTFTSLAYADSLNKIKDDEQRLRWLSLHHRISEEERQKELGSWAIRSTDNGITWSARMNTLVNSPHGPIALTDGRLLYVGKKLWSSANENGVVQSLDDGQTWQWLTELPVRNGDVAAAYHEWHAVETASGRIIVQMRNHNPVNNNETLQCESDDGGKTWTTPHNIGVWGFPSHLLKLQNNAVLMTYGHRRAPLGNQARISYDEGNTWSAPMVIYGDAASDDLGYPSTVQLKDGTLITVWYERTKDNSKAVLKMFKWKLR